MSSAFRPAHHARTTMAALCSAAMVIGLSTVISAGFATGVASAATHTVDKAKAKSTTTTSKSKGKKTASTTTSSTTVTHTTTVSAADTWLLKAIGAEANLGSVRIVGNVEQSTGDIILSIDVNGDGEGGGTFKQQGSTIQLKRIGTLLYFNAPTKFWAAHASAAQTKEYGGKWIEVSALNSEFTSFDQFLNAGDLVAAVFQGHTTPLVLSKPTTYEGHKVLIVSDTIVYKGKKTTGQMYIQDKGKPYVLKIVDRGPSENSTIYFSDYTKAKSIEVPPEPINLS